MAHLRGGKPGGYEANRTKSLDQGGEAIRDYVLWDSGLQNKGASTVLLHVTHSNLKAYFMELRLDRHMTIERVKEKMRTHCGTGSAFMHLTLMNEHKQVVADMSDDSLMLGYFSPQDGWTIHITDLDANSLSANGGLEDVSLVQKYEITEEDYLKRDGNFRSWKADKLAEDPTWTFSKQIKRQQDEKKKKADPNFVPEPEYKPVTDDDHMADLAAAIKVGDRCEVNPGGKRGEAKFVGRIPAIAAGWFVGVQYDEPVGKNDGTCKGKRFFECPPSFGGFLRPDKVTAGDYPELDLFDEDEDEPEIEE